MAAVRGEQEPTGGHTGHTTATSSHLPPPSRHPEAEPPRDSPNTEGVLRLRCELQQNVTLLPTGAESCASLCGKQPRGPAHTPPPRSPLRLLPAVTPSSRPLVTLLQKDSSGQGTPLCPHSHVARMTHTDSRPGGHPRPLPDYGTQSVDTLGPQMKYLTEQDEKKTSGFQ